MEQTAAGGKANGGGRENDDLPAKAVGTVHQVVPGHVVPLSRKRGPLETLFSWPYACVCGMEIQEMAHHGRLFECRDCKLLYKKHRDHGIEPVWATKDNQVLPISEIPLKHLKAIVGLLLIKHNWRESYRKLMIDELEKRLSEEDNANGTST